MIFRRFHRFVLFGSLALILASVVFAVAAANSVPATNLDDQQFAITVNDLKPPECSALNLTAIVECAPGGGTCRGTAANELILGTSWAETIRGQGGTDCIMGGGGNDTLRGGSGADVCIGGPGDDTFINCATAIP